MKILVTGNAGAGKSTTSKLLEQKLGIKRYNLDPIVWQSGWKKAPLELRSKQIDELVSLDSWIIDGVSPRVLQAADVIVFLDFPRRICYWRALKRSGRYLFKTRPELPKNSPEILIIPRLIKIIWKFPSLVVPNILVQKARLPKDFVHIRSNGELFEYLESMNKNRR